jgi:hypothetical protein
VTGSWYVNGQGDSQLVIDKDGVEDNELRLTVFNHDAGEMAYIVADSQELLRVITLASQEPAS